MAGRIEAALGSLAFLVLAPGVVAGLIPWLITGWRPLPPGDGPGALRWTGLILIAVGLAVVLEAFARFALEGIGTPAPIAPTRTLVVSGFYRFVRNPMYIAVTTMIFGQVSVFRTNRAAALRLIGWQQFGPDELAQIRAVGRKYIHSLLESKTRRTTRSRAAAVRPR